MGVLDRFKRPHERRDGNDKRDAGLVHIMSLLGPEDAWPKGLPSQAVAGAYRGAEPPEQLQGNPSFIALMHDVIRRCGPADAEMRSAAQGRGEGYLYVIDACTPDGISGAVPPEDIIGAFKVEGGALVEDSYVASPSYVVYRKGRGLVQLPGALDDALVEALRGLPPVEPDGSGGG